MWWFGVFAIVLFSLIYRKRAGPVPIEDGAASVVEAAMPTANVAGSVELPKPSKICTTEPDFYEWKDITSEFFESVKGNLSVGGSAFGVAGTLPFFL